MNLFQVSFLFLNCSSPARIISSLEFHPLIKMRFTSLKFQYILTIKCIGVPRESGVWVTSLSSVMHINGVGESIWARMSKERSGMDEASESSVFKSSKLKTNQ